MRLFKGISCQCSHIVLVKIVLIKDYIEEIDFQEPSFAVVNWPISEFYGASILYSIMHYFDQCATDQLANVFLIAGVWVSVDFDSKDKILWG